MTQEFQTLAALYEEAFLFFDKTQQTPEIFVNFYPYVGINHTIRRRNGRIFVRISALCREMPLREQKALAFILVAKLLRKQVPSTERIIYSSFVKSPAIQAKARENKQNKGKKLITTSKGDVYDLNKIFEKINRTYFNNVLTKPTLSWSARKTYRILGHHDSAHNTIVISKSLDDEIVPQFVVEFVVFHEMLHIFHPTKLQNGRRLNHTPEFRRDERKFLYFSEAENWIEQNVNRLKRNCRKSANGKRKFDFSRLKLIGK